MVSRAAVLAAIVALAACAGAPAHGARSAPARAVDEALAMRFDNWARDHVHVYLVGERREWLLGRVEAGGRARLRVPEAALTDAPGSLRMVVVAGGRATLRAAHATGATVTPPQSAASLLAQRWSFSRPGPSGQLATLRPGGAAGVDGRSVCAYSGYTHSAPPPMNTRFAVATHILTFLQSQAGEPATSELIASSVGTNASLIRRLLSQLARAGLTTSQMGTGGGALLARPAERVTLLDVYDALGEDADVIPIHETASPRCPVGRHVQAALEGRVRAAERAMRDELARTTIADLCADVLRRERRRAAGGAAR
jgi:Rrf2 family protein